MTEPAPGDLATAADSVLALVAATRVEMVAVRLFPEALKLLAGRGVVLPPDPSHDQEEWVLDQLGAEQQRASVDVVTLLGEVCQAHGLSVGPKVGEHFQRIVASWLPCECGIFFLLDNAVPLYSVVALAAHEVYVVIHVNSDLPPDLNTALHAIGVHAVRLREIGSINNAEVASLVGVIPQLRSAAQVTADASTASAQTAAVVAAQESVDPSRVADYARTAGADTLFEVAVARILWPLVGGIEMFGSRFIGKPVPDGIAFDAPIAMPTARREVVSYDCKSKKKDSYTLDAGDADQQARYMAILRRLQDTGRWSPVGVWMFTPSISQEDFDNKIGKDHWRTFTDQKYRLLMIEANHLRRLNELIHLEPPGGLSATFNPLRFWKALNHGVLDGVADKECDRLLPQRARYARRVSLAEVEIAYLAGFTAPGAFSDVGAAVAEADPDLDAHQISRPHVIRALHKALRSTKASLADLQATSGGFTPKAIEYFLVAKVLHPASAEEFGENGIKNLKRLQLEAHEA